MDIIYKGNEFKRLLTESIPGYKPVIGGNADSENEKINKKANKDSMKNVQMNKPKEESKPVAYTKNQSTDIGNNKNMLDLVFDNEPDEQWKKNVKKQVTGENSELGNGSEDSENIKGNKAFYNAAKKALKDYTDNRKKLEDSGLSGKNLPVDKKNSAFESVNHKTKELFFKNTKFLSESHMFSLIPEDYKKEDNCFIMKDKYGEEYLIEWKIKDSISEGVITNHSNKGKLNEEFDRIKKLYAYNSGDHAGNLTSKNRVLENEEVSKNIKKLREVSDI